MNEPVNKMDEFLRVLATARHERSPSIDISRRVMVQVRKYSQPVVVSSSAPLAVFAGLSLSTAALVTVLALPAWRLEHSPFAALFEPFARLLH